MLGKNGTHFVPEKADEPIRVGIRIHHDGNWFNVIGPSHKGPGNWELQGYISSSRHGFPSEARIHLTEEEIREDICNLVAENTMKDVSTRTRVVTASRRDILNAILKKRGMKAVPRDLTLKHRGVLQAY
jgi:hypothetical protein